MAKKTFYSNINREINFLKKSKSNKKAGGLGFSRTDRENDKNEKIVVDTVDITDFMRLVIKRKIPNQSLETLPPAFVI